MAIEVLMPQMGESVTEGTVTKWLKKEGDTVGRDEPLFEISTEKVDAEIPSPSSGTLTKILVREGQTVAVRAVVAQIEPTSAEQKPSAPPRQPEVKAAAPKPAPTPSPTPAAPPPPPPTAAKPSGPALVPPKQPERPRQPEPVAEKGEEIRTSPLVRRLAAENAVNLSEVQGTGLGGRITKEDLLAFVDRRKTQPPVRERAAKEVPPAAAPELEPETAAAPAATPGEREEVVAMSAMRKKIAEHMIMSRHTSAHVTTVFQIDLTKVNGVYQREKERFERQENTRLGYTPFFIRAIIDGLKRFPILNSSVSGDNIVYKKDIHIGVAVALDWGLIVPVIHNADEKSFLGLTRAINDLADRARRKSLSVREVQGGTFTITNPGALGSLFATPIINQPQVGIVGVGAVKKMPVVIDDAIAIRPIVHLSLSYDHRIIDGYVADQFMATVKSYLENWEETIL
ncbi:MAG: 2-oxo acid dehydrogenase subunit E2 [Acidobacteria bacterium]|nr:2-oxo acid dehydrogenase subunit E2 [Acidobacteriota bacterium]